jgi:hypothetical protein
MTYKTTYWDEQAKEQKERDCTVEEIAEIEARKAAAQLPVVPEEVTMYQARRALAAAGLLAAVEAAISAAGTVAQIEWDTKNLVHRSYGMVSDMGQALGMTDAQLDALFISAATF